MTATLPAHDDLLSGHAPTPSWFRDRVIKKCARGPWHRYPELSGELRARVAGHYRVGPRNVLVTRGCTEAIALALGWVAAHPPAGRVTVAVPTPSWPGFTHLADRAGLAWSHYPVRLGPPADGVPVVCTPNNPTGDTVTGDALAALCDHRDRPAIIDCTYDDYATTSALAEAPRLLDGHAFFCVNLGKSSGLAAARLGLVIAAEDIVAELEAAADPFRLDAFQLAVLDTLFTERGLRAWRDLVDGARSAGARCVALLAATAPCVRVTPPLGHVVYGRYGARCAHLDALFAATNATVFPVERRFRLRADDTTLAALTALPADGTCR